MWRYLKAAFLVGVPVPGLGRLPLNVMGAAAFGILGFAEPSLWLLGLGLETSVLFALTTSERFRRVVDAEQLSSSEHDVEAQRRTLITTLPPDLQRRLIDLTRTCRRVLEVSEQSDDFLVETNRDALQRLEWVYLKLLVARNNLAAIPDSSAETNLKAQVAELSKSLSSGSASASLRHSKEATLAILQERLANVRRRAETLDEIESDLARIEAQTQLLLENATMQGKPSSISTDIELASNLASSNLYGDSGTAVADIDLKLGKKAVVSERE